MAIYRFDDNTFTEVAKTSLRAENIYERGNLQQAIRKQIGVIAPECLVISEEFSQWVESKDRIDLLAIDKDANLVVIELKRTETGDYMELQALRYASLVANLTFEKTIEIYQAHLDKGNRPDGQNGDAEQLLLDFLDWDGPDPDSFAPDVRIILVSGNFSRELTTSVLWLSETKDMHISCVRIILYKNGKELLIDIQQIIPLPEATEYQIQIKQKQREQRLARHSSKDFSKYVFNGKEHNKRRLVLAVVQHWLAEHRPKSVDEFNRAFPLSIKNGDLIKPFIEAKEVFDRHGKDRHFLDFDDLISFAEGDFAVSNQWSVHNLGKFLKAARALGYNIEKIEEPGRD